MCRVKHPARSEQKDGARLAGTLGVKAGCARQWVAPAIPNCAPQPECRPQSRAAQPACASRRTLDGASARRLPTADSSLTYNTVASLRSGRQEPPHARQPRARE
jgi:hypothetical protein